MRKAVNAFDEMSKKEHKTKGGKQTDDTRSNVNDGGQGWEDRGQGQNASEEKRVETDAGISSSPVVTVEEKPEYDGTLASFVKASHEANGKAISSLSHNVCTVESYQNAHKILRTDPATADILIELRNIARRLLDNSKVLLGSHLQLCNWIVEHQISPEEVKEELSGVGFTDSHISQIKRVCFTSNQIFLQYKKRIIGFKVALERARRYQCSEGQLKRRWWPA